MTQHLSESSTIPVASTSTSLPAELEEMGPLRGSLLSVAPSYGSIGPASRASGSISPKLGRVIEEQASTFISLEEAEEEIELDLEDQGYFVGSYPRLIHLYTLVPFTSLATWLLLGVLIPLAFVPGQPRPPHPKFFPSPIPEFITSAAFWSFSYQLRLPFFSLISSVVKNSNVAVILHTSSHVIINNLLRLAILPILHIRDDMQHHYPARTDYAFFRIWWASLGWSFAEVVVAIWQGYEQLALYRDVMIPPSRVKEFLGAAVPPEERDCYEIPITDLVASTDLLLPQQPSDNEEDELEQNLDKLVRIKSRGELEQVYGVPVIDIPVFITCLQRIDSIILSLGTTLLVAWAYLRSSISLPSPDAHDSPHRSWNDTAFFTAFLLVCLIHMGLAVLFTPPVLARIGVHTAAYSSLLVALGLFFGGLAVWGILT